MSEIIRHGSRERSVTSTAQDFRADFRRSGPSGDDARRCPSGQFHAHADGRLAVDFGAVAPPRQPAVEMGMMIPLGAAPAIELLLPDRGAIGRPEGEQLSIEAIDEMLAQYVETGRGTGVPLHRKWLQKHAAQNMERAPQQLKMARQMDSRCAWRCRCG